MTLEVRIRNTSTNALPQYATAGSAGVDLCAAIAEPLTLQPMQRHLVPTGLFMEIPAGYEGQVRPRSGLAINQGITCLNSPGTVDSDYRGEIKIVLVNLSNQPQIVQPGQRIAQMVFCKVEKVMFTLTLDLTQTERGAGGFGHTGTH